jgi:hypothetical protein
MYKGINGFEKNSIKKINGMDYPEPSTASYNGFFAGTCGTQVSIQTEINNFRQKRINLIQLLQKILEYRTGLIR